MSIIINDFEIVSPPPGDAVQTGQRAPGTGPSEQAAAPQTVQPDDIERILHRSFHRRLRLWAD